MAAMQDNTSDTHHDTVGTVAALKRSASSAFESTDDGSSRKKLREDSMDAGEVAMPISEPSVDGQALADELEQELQCGCCSALVYRPVLVHPCQHFFCGRYDARIYPVIRIVSPSPAAV